MVTLPVTLSDPWPLQTTPFSTFCTAFHIFVFDVVGNFKFADDKSPLKWAWSGSHDTFYHFIPLKSLQLLQLETSNFVHDMATWNISLVMTNCPHVGVVGVMWPISTFCGPWHIFGADEVRHFKFGLQIERKESYHYTWSEVALENIQTSTIGS